MGRLLRRLRYWLGQRERDAALRAEIEFHRALKQQELEAAGMPPDAARFGAAREVGNVTLAREAARAEWIWPWLDSVGQDTRFAVRSLLRQPGFTLLSVVVLGVAIGLNTSLFTVFAGLALRPMAGLTDGDRVVTVTGMSYPEFRYLAAQSQTLTGLSATRNSSVSLEAGGAVRSTVMNAVSGNYFSMLGVRMALGRGFLPDEDREGAPRPVVVLGYRLWQARFDADPAIVGTAVRLNDADYTVVGVAPREFTGTDGAAMALWVPIASLPVLRPHDPGERHLLTDADDCCVSVVGRLTGSVTRKQAEAELRVFSDRFRANRAPGEPRPIALDGTQFLRGRRAASTALAVIGVLFAGLVLVLLLACANVGNLVLARSAARTSEIGVRLSLGAGRSRIVRQLLTEGFVLALLASTVGFSVASWVPPLVLNRVAGQPAPFDIDPDFAVIAYAIVLAAVACLTFALAPALHVTRAGVMASLKQTMPKRSSMRLRSVLLGIQVAITVVLLTSAGLLLRGVVQARAIDPGLRVDGLAIAKIELPEEAYDITRATVFLRELTDGLRDAGLRSFGFTSTEPFGATSRFVGIRLAGEGKERTQNIEWMSVSPDYFQTLGIPMTEGRAFVAADAQGAAIVNETTARRYWNGRNAVGQSVIVGGNRPVQVVGVVKDTLIDGLDDVPPLLFLPLARAQADDFPRLLFESDERVTAAAVTRLVGQMERRARVEIQPLGDRLNEQLADLALAPLAASVLGLFGLGLATVGMFGVFGYVVRQRTREIGIRIALGARSSEIIRLVLTGSSRPVAAGLAVGIAGALGASRVLRSELYGVSPLDPLTYGAVALLLAAAAMAASYLPARRAARLNPTQALRE